MQRSTLNDVAVGGHATLQWPLVERRQRGRRLPQRQPVWNVNIEQDDRRLGLGRRWDDWRRRLEAA
jgi:hypothetical protein